MASQKKLNKQQQQAVKHGGGPLLIIAGAGTGKTTVITERVLHLISKELAKPEEILALTFTEKASREMEERVDVALPLGYSNMWISTFHAFCDRVLRADALAIGLTTDYHLMNEAENIAFVRRHLFEFELEYFRPLGNPTKFIEGLLQHFSRLQDEDITPDEYLKWVATLKQTTPEEELEQKKYLELAKAYEKYESLKIAEGAFDYGDLLAKTLLLFRERPNVLQEYQKKFKYILIDEFQDTNYSQFQLSILLAGKEKNITVVGDDDQSIYRFRGASISNILQFRRYFPETKVVVLTENYRSAQTILDYAYQAIQFNNPDRLEVVEQISKKLVAAGNKQKGVVELIHVERVEDEAESVAQKIGKLIDQGYSWRDVAILVRANNHADVFVRTFERMGIPHQFLGPGKLFANPHVANLIAYLKVLYNFKDSLSLYKLLSIDFFAIPQKELIKWSNAARRQNISLFELLETEEQEIIKNILTIIKRQMEELKTKTPGQLLYEFLQESGLLAYILADTQENVVGATASAKFFEKLKQFENETPQVSIENAVDWITLSSNFGEPAATSDTDWTQIDAVNIMSIHASKGLEFPIVFMVNLVSQRFPTTQRREQIPLPTEILKEVLPQGDYHLQEERRLFYVGMTRARDQLYFTAADFYGGEGGRQKKVSQFVQEAFGEVELPKAPAKTSKKKVGEEKKIQRHTVTRLSYSQIETFQTCPMHYKLRYVLGIETPPSASQSFGISIHRTLQEYFSDTSQNIEELLKKNWIREGYLDKKHQQMSLERASRYVARFVEKKFAIPSEVEKGFEFRINDLVITGVMDAVFTNGDKIEIVDFKTSDNIPTQKEVDKNLQLTIYALAASKLFNKKPDQIILSLYYFENQEKITTSRTAKQLADAEDEILAVREEMENSDFTCFGSFFCQNCEFASFCHTSQ